MKKNSIYALMSAIALAGAIGFSSCSSTEDEADVNPGYDPATGDVPVQFLFNLSSNTVKSNTRQTADATQATENLAANKFRGIEDAHVLCFTKGNPNTTNGNYVSVTTSQASKDFDMARVAMAKSLGNDGTTTRVLEMTLPLSTNSMVFYGRAIKEADKDAYGYLDEYNVGANLSNVSFKLGKRLTADDKTEFHSIQNLLAGILTCVMNVKRGNVAVGADDKPGEGIDKYGFDIPVDERTENLTWASYYVPFSSYRQYYKEHGVYPDNIASPVEDGRSLTELEIKLGRVFYEMTTIETGELRNGSGPAIIATISELWAMVNAVRCAQPTSFAEAVAKYMAQLIHQELMVYFEGTFDTTALKEGGGPNSVSIKGTSAIIPLLCGDNNWPIQKPAEGDFTISLSNLNTFPATFNVPQGSCYLEYDRTHNTYSYVQNYNSGAVGGVPFTVDDYYYPAELLYFGNSPVRVSDEAHMVAQYPQLTPSKWDSESNTNTTDPWYGWKWGGEGEVTSSTRSVAMRNDINYGTALLAMTVGYTGETLKDNNAAIQDRDYGTIEPDIEITPTASTFQLIGVVIGGQYPRVGWDYLPALKPADNSTNPVTPAERVGFIYDEVIADDGAIPSSGSSTPNYTLVFDNYNASEADNNQDIVYIALELKNNSGKDFFGIQNMIANGSNFYLIGALNPRTKAGPNLPTYHALPPYKAELTEKTVPRVFIQDHKTIVNFKIGENTLKSAYLTVPDLRSSSVTLGLSVDMSWSAGLDFGDVVLGGTE